METNTLTVWQVQEWDDGELMFDRLFRSEVVARMAAIQLVYSFLEDDNAEVEFGDRGIDNEWVWIDDEFEVVLQMREVQ